VSLRLPYLDLRPALRLGWSCPAGHQPPRTPNCSCCGTRSPSCAAPMRALS